LNADLRGCLREELAHVRVVEHEPEVGLEEVDAAGILRVKNVAGQRSGKRVGGDALVREYGYVTTNSRKDDFLRGAVLALQRASYLQALCRGAYPVPRVHEQAFCAGLREPRALLSHRCLRVVRSGAAGSLGGGGIGGACVMRCRG